ncbi:MAG: type II/IV secretion system ATPase subunit, partial [Candidatus Bathyarchaeia archaeon]
MGSQWGNIKKRFDKKKQVTVTEDNEQKKAAPAKKGLKLKINFKKQGFGPQPELEAEIPEPVSVQIDGEILETYPINPPYCYINIVRDRLKGNISYVVDEPKLSASDAANLQRLKSILNQVLVLKPSDMQSKKAASKYLLQVCQEIMDSYNFNLSPDDRNKLLYYIVRDNLGFGKIDALMHDQLIEDVSCDGVDVPLYIWHRKFESIPTNLKFDSARELDSFALRLAYMCGSHVSIAQPMLDASLPDGSRINLTYGSEVTRKGSTFTIRKFKVDPFTVTDLVTFSSLS